MQHVCGVFVTEILTHKNILFLTSIHYNVTE